MISLMDLNDFLSIRRRCLQRGHGKPSVILQSQKDPNIFVSKIFALKDLVMYEEVFEGFWKYPFLYIPI